MAIIRCPYCHAIIDENDKYCNNCGTQLLFPEDESVEEEIPGEKIIEAEPEDEEKDYEVEEPGKEAAAAAGADEETKDLTGEPATGPWGGTEPPAVDKLIEEEAAGEEEKDLEEAEDETEEVILVDEIAAEEAAAGAEEEPAPEEETRTYEAASAVEKEIEDAVEPSAEIKESTEEISEPPAPAPAPAGQSEEPAAEESEEPLTKESEEETPDTAPVERDEVRTGEIPDEEIEEPAPVPAAARPVTFDTRELEGIGRTVDLGKEHVDKLMEVMAGKQKEDETPAEEAPKAKPEQKTGTLPPWADKIRGSAAGVDGEPEEELEAEEEAFAGAAESAETAEETAEEEIFPRRKPSDSGIGFPERLTQAVLPFEPAAAAAEEGEEAAEEEPAASPAARQAVEPKEGLRPSLREETGAEGGLEEEAGEARPPFHLTLFLKAKAFDVLFVGVFWLVALWVAARSMGATLFELLSVTSGSVLLLYGVYILLYFFLFKFFLGETLGDRLFRERE